jgi:hypothetical protein
MAVRALAIPKSVSHDARATPKLLFLVTGRALDRGVPPLERIAGQLLVLERLDPERRGEVTGVAGPLGLGEPELPGVSVAVAPFAFARHAPIGRSPSAETVLLRRIVAAVTGRLGVGAGERPCAVIDLRGLPAALRVAMRATAVAHLGGKLLTVWVLVTVPTGPGLHAQDVPGPLRLVTIAARDELVSCLERKLGSCVLLDGEPSRPKAMLIVAAGAVGGTQGSAVYVSMAVRAPIELEASKSLLRRKLG